MKAIDFACRLLARLAEDEHPFPTQQVLLAVAAGLETSPDIARFTGISSSACSGILRSLAHKNILCRTGGTHASYLLAPAGKELVRQYFSFLPGSRA